MKYEVGMRVRTKGYAGTVWNGEGVIVEDAGPWFIVKMGDRTGGFDPGELEPVAVAQQPQPLRIQNGRHYITRDGRKVGLMRRWSDVATHRWEADDDDLPYIWADDGTEIDSDIDDGADLVAEADEPPAEPQSTKEILDELEAWIAEQEAAKEAGNGSTAGFTVPLCALEAEPDLTAIGKAYADGYAAGLQAGSEEASDKAAAAHCFRDDVDRVVLDCLKRFKQRGLLAA